MNKCCDCRKETECKEHRGNHKYCFKPKEHKNVRKIGMAMVEQMIRAYEKYHKENEK